MGPVVVQTMWAANRSPRSYATAVALSGVLGFLGAQHFYLGRWVEGAIDVALTVGWITALAFGEPWVALPLALADFGHAFVCTILLLTGSMNDGDGLRVCYPGQKLARGDEEWTRPPMR